MRSLNLPDAEFRTLARRLADFSADYLERVPKLPSYPPGISGQETEALFSGDVPWEGRGAAAFDCLDDVFRLSRPASPRFFGYVFGSGDPIGALGEFAMAVLHQNAAAWRSAPAGVTIERTVVRWLASAVGCDGFSGSLTLGGSSANLMGLCMAREAKMPELSMAELRARWFARLTPGDRSAIDQVLTVRRGPHVRRELTVENLDRPDLHA